MKLSQPLQKMTSDGLALVIRSPDRDDAEALADFVNAVWAEADHLLFAPGERSVTVADERDLIDRCSASETEVIFIAECDGATVAMIDFHGGRHARIRHTTAFGMSVAQPWRGRGIGRAILGTGIAWMRRNTPWEKVCLDVLADNGQALRLYRSLGFEEEGRLKRHVRRGPGHDVDLLQMAKWL